jgi:hypothetical protein
VGNQDEGLWVSSEVSASGTYVVGINVDADRAWTLDEDGAVRYARAVLRVAHSADHDAAVIKLLTKFGTPAAEAAKLVGYNLRPDRAPFDHDATKPLRFEPGVNQKGEPFVKVLLDGRQIGQITAPAAMEHAVAVLEVVATVDLDAALYRLLVGQINLDDGTARAVVGDLASHRSLGADDA